MDWYLDVLKKYAVFTGRARRKEFWMYWLFYFIVAIVLGIIDGILGTRSSNGVGLLSSLYSLALFIPSVAVSVRRLHDTNRSGWFILIALIPVVGWIVLLVFYCMDSQAGDNQYGPYPKAGTA